MKFSCNSRHHVVFLLENKNSGVDLIIYSEHVFSVPTAQVLHAGRVRCSRSFCTLRSYIHILQLSFYLLFYQICFCVSINSFLCVQCIFMILVFFSVA